MADVLVALPTSNFQGILCWTSDPKAAVSWLKIYNIQCLHIGHGCWDVVASCMMVWKCLEYVLDSWTIWGGLLWRQPHRGAYIALRFGRVRARKHFTASNRMPWEDMWYRWFSSKPFSSESSLGWYRLQAFKAKNQKTLPFTQAT